MLINTPKARDGPSVDSKKDAIPPVVSKTRNVDTALSEQIKADTAAFFAKKKKSQFKKGFKSFNANKIDVSSVIPTTHVDAPEISFDQGLPSNNVDLKAAVDDGWSDAVTAWGGNTTAVNNNVENVAELLDMQSMKDVDVAEKLRIEETKAQLVGAKKGMANEAEQMESKSPRVLQRWACQRCSGLFLKKKECIEHMRKCSGGRKKMESAPNFVFVCHGCIAHFDTSKACQLHIKSCVEVCPKKETEPKSVCTPAKAKSEPPKSACTPVKVKCEPVAPLTQWACIHCNQGFAKKASCMSHIIRNECSRNDSEQNLIPVLMYACPCCSILFPTAKTCRLHIKTCRSSNQSSTSSKLPPM